MSFRSICLIGILTAILIPGVVFSDELVTLDTRKGVKQTFLLLEPKAEIKGVVITFPASKGVVHFSENSPGRYNVNYERGGFTINETTRKTYRKNGLVIAVVAHPSDMDGGMSTEFRSSNKHLKDIKSVIEYLKTRYKKEPYLHGHCRSSFSPVSIATKLRNNDIAGLILSSPRASGKHGSVTDYQSGIISLPILLVQHKEDPRKGSLYKNFDKVVRFFKKSSKQVDIILVEGGKGGDGAHSFKGLQKETVQEIANWILEKEVSNLIND